MFLERVPGEVLELCAEIEEAINAFIIPCAQVTCHVNIMWS